MQRLLIITALPFVIHSQAVSSYTATTSTSVFTIPGAPALGAAPYVFYDNNPDFSTTRLMRVTDVSTAANTVGSDMGASSGFYTFDNYGNAFATDNSYFIIHNVQGIEAIVHFNPSGFTTIGYPVELPFHDTNFDFTSPTTLYGLAWSGFKFQKYVIGTGLSDVFDYSALAAAPIFSGMYNHMDATSSARLFADFGGPAQDQEPYVIAYNLSPGGTYFILNIFEGTIYNSAAGTTTPIQVNINGTLLDFWAGAPALQSGTDLASANGTTSPCTVTSAYSFGSGDVGRVLNVTAGTNWTVNRYQITSVSGGAAILNKACGTSASLSGGTWAMIALGVHSIAADRSGQYLNVALHGGVGGNLVWDITNGTMKMLNSCGHDSYGYGYRGGLGNQGSTDCTVGQATDITTTNLATPFTDVHLNPGAATYSGSWMDMHWSWSNAGPSLVTPPFFATPFINEGNGTESYNAEWIGELIAVCAACGSFTVWRFADTHCHWNTSIPSLNNQPWDQARVNVSQDGKYALFDSNWDSLLGTDPNHSNYPRHDVFLVDLLSAGASTSNPRFKGARTSAVRLGH